ncbi:helix-turn-helix transcriptional regulator [Shimia sp. R11_0]|uniref:helix-turn-helix domain-containing protein n=1 Tax=Shimia sp. R11_0 TaxID=2821096 RepID=UPI001ADA6C06|nr:helix-turn-helix transcriptional regulator [Shimia sp. R11_0]MBO9477846.1 helix-turn-helix transcriptional regulator [Shimia sp. R11_0]
MTVLTIDPQRLNTVRKARKIGRPKLAKLVGLTERQLTKLETASTSVTLPEATLIRIATVLQIPAPALTGELPLGEGNLEPVQPIAHSSSCSCCG